MWTTWHRVISQSGQSATECGHKRTWGVLEPLEQNILEKCYKKLASFCISLTSLRFKSEIKFATFWRNHEVIFKRKCIQFSDILTWMQRNWIAFPIYVLSQFSVSDIYGKILTKKQSIVIQEIIIFIRKLNTPFYSLSLIFLWLNMKDLKF